MRLTMYTWGMAVAVRPEGQVTPLPRLCENGTPFSPETLELLKLRDQVFEPSSLPLAGDQSCDLRPLHQPVRFGRNRSGVTIALVRLVDKLAVRETLGKKGDELLLLKGKGHGVKGFNQAVLTTPYCRSVLTPKWAVGEGYGS